MGKLKEILFKKHYIREIMTLFFIVLSLLFLSIYTSLAIFSESYEIKSIASIQASTLNVTMSMPEQPSETTTKTITILAGETYFTDINLTNNSNISVRYKLYYSGSIDNNLVKIGVSDSSQNKENGILSSNNEDGYKKTIRVGIENGSTSNVTITFGIQIGYSHNNVSLITGNALIDTIDEGYNPCATKNALACKILGDNYVNVTTTEPTFSSTSTDRGLFVQQGDATKSIDGKPTYYFRGSSTNTNEGYNPDYVMNNYVKFGKYQTTDGENTVGEDIVWRIVRINEDGSIRLITINSISKATKLWNSQTSSNYINSDGTYSIAKNTVETWYQNNIGNNNELDNKVVQSSFCNDISENYTAVDRRLTSNLPSPIFTCPHNSIMVNEKVGLITADEIIYAGVYYTNGNPQNDKNISYILPNVSSWTMTPYNNISVFQYNNAVGFRYDYVDDADASGVFQAVINLKADITVSDGDGLSAETAYVINIDD